MTDLVLAAQEALGANSDDSLEFPKGHYMCCTGGPWGRPDRFPPSRTLVPISQGWVMGLFLPSIPGPVHCPEVYSLHWFLVEKLKLGIYMIDLTLQVLLT